MTPRAVLLGLLGVCLFCALGFFNDFVLRQTFMIGTYMPVPIFGGAILLILIANPVIARLRLIRPLAGAEIAIAVAIMLAASFIPGRGLLHHFTVTLMLPHHYVRTTPAWQDAGVLDMAPPRTLADISRNESTRLDGFVQGLGEGAEHISPREVPWPAWTAPMAFWMPVILTMTVALTGLALVVHRQWSDHEQIPYPIVTVMHALLPAPGRLRGAVFAEPGFWIAGGVVFLIHANNYCATWWPDFLVPVRLSYNFTPLVHLSETLRLGGNWSLTTPRILFTVVGFAFFLSTDVSLSMGLAAVLHAVIIGVSVTYGASLTGGLMAPVPDRFLYAGAYMGFFLVLLYTGRHYYTSVLKKSLGIHSGDPVEASAIWGARAFLAATALFIAQMVLAGLDWQIAVAYTALFLAVSTVLSRVVAETGAFFIHTFFYPDVILIGFLGVNAFGPQSILLLFLFTVVLMVDPREIYMPFAVHALKLVDLSRVPTGRTAALGLVAVLLGLAVATPVTLYWQYDRGALAVGDGWTLGVPRMPFDEAANLTRKLDAQGRLEEVAEIRGWSRLLAASPDWRNLVAFAATFSLVLLFTWLRMRFSWWPLHPVLFLALGSFQSSLFGFSFLVGWLLKKLTMKYGGAEMYRRLKPVMIGLIVGEMLAGVISMIIGFVYYLIQGEPPISYSVFSF